ncbi:MAG TPA: hypothetical protein DCX54_03690 [Flavobacteriales bacterium]|nr:hypothetical protein [Flavobacteriales bacterium]
MQKKLHDKNKLAIAKIVNSSFFNKKIFDEWKSGIASIKKRIKKNLPHGAGFWYKKVIEYVKLS